jgi:hypothetical protein
MRRLAFAVLTALIVSLVPAAAARAVITIGSNLERPVNLELDCGASSCTYVQTALPGSSVAAGGFVSPVNGIVTSWRIRAGADTTVTALRTVDPLGGELFSGRGISAFESPAPNSTTSFPASVPIAAGDLIGLQMPGAPVDYVVAGGGSMASFQPVLADGVPRSPGSTTDREIAINADVEPTSAFEHGKLRRLNDRRVRIRVTVPNPGDLSAASRKGPLSTGGVVKGDLIKPGFKRVMEAGDAVLKLKLTGRARRLLARDGTLRTRVFISFRPTFGAVAVTQKVTAKLKG